MFDNIYLNPEYVESIIVSIPTGMFTDRDIHIHGQWVSAAGVIYKDFRKDVHYITAEQFK